MGKEEEEIKKIEPWWLVSNNKSKDEMEVRNFREFVVVWQLSIPHYRFILR